MAVAVGSFANRHHVLKQPLFANDCPVGLQRLPNVPQQEPCSGEPSCLHQQDALLSKHWEWKTIGIVLFSI
jgi:hypothetical protein